MRNKIVLRQFALLGSINGFLAVALGAFGAHGLRGRISPEMLEVYKTGVLYHLVHALVLLLVALLAERMTELKIMRRAGWLLQAGIVLFSGSLYALAISGVHILGAITPLGGVCFLAGWAMLAVAAFQDGK